MYLYGHVEIPTLGGSSSLYIYLVAGIVSVTKRADWLMDDDNTVAGKTVQF